jgi:hypothetical protein
MIGTYIAIVELSNPYGWALMGLGAGISLFANVSFTD